MQSQKQHDNLMRRSLLLFFMCMIVMIIAAPGCSLLPNWKFGDGPKRSSNQFSSEPAAQLKNSSVSIDRSAERISEEADIIKDSSENIFGRADSLIKDTEDPKARTELYGIQKEASEIINSAESVKQSAGDIEGENKNVKGASYAVESIEKDLFEYNQEGAAEAKQNIYKLIIGMATVGGVIIMAGIALSFFNAKTGGMLAGFGLIVTMVAIAGTYYLKWIALAGFGLLAFGLLGTLALLTRTFWRARVLEDSHEASVELIDDMKEIIPESEREKIFEEDGKAGKLQSKYVKKEVQKTRQKIKKRATRKKS